MVCVAHVRKAVVLNLDNSNTAMFDVQSSLVDATRIISLIVLWKVGTMSFRFDTKAVRQALRLFESLHLAFIYDLQLSQLPLNLFFDRQASINFYNISSPCQSQNYPLIVIANQMRLPSKS